MRKPFLLFRGPVKTISGYGSHSRDLLESLYNMNQFDIRVDSCNWGYTPMTALKKDNLFHNWIESNIITTLTSQPDIYVQVTVPNEFQPIGKFNIGITAGIETTIAPKEWIDGCNKMDLIITTSNFSKDVLSKTVYQESNPINKNFVNELKIIKPIEVLFEGVNTEIYNNKYTNIDLDFKEDFQFLFVGHWLPGILGEDRKDVGMLIKTFAETFKNMNNRPGLVLKTSSVTFSIKDRENIRKKIEDIVRNIENPPSIYLLFGELTDYEMNQLYNHPKIKAMITLTKGEGFGRPMLEFSMTGKLVIASNWSGHKDFLPLEKALLIGGVVKEVDQSSINHLILKESKWFTANYDEASAAMKSVFENYKNYTTEPKKLGLENSYNFSLSKMKDKLEQIINTYCFIPVEQKLILPELNSIDL